MYNMCDIPDSTFKAKAPHELCLLSYKNNIPAYKKQKTKQKTLMIWQCCCNEFGSTCFCCFCVCECVRACVLACARLHSCLCISVLSDTSQNAAVRSLQCMEHGFAILQAIIKLRSPWSESDNPQHVHSACSTEGGSITAKDHCLHWWCVHLLFVRKLSRSCH